MQHRLKVKSLVLTVFMAGVLLIGVNIPRADAAVLTYRDVSPRTSGIDTQARLWSHHSVSGNGRYVVFSSSASNIITGDTNGTDDVFVRDTINNTTTRASVSSSGSESNSSSEFASISQNGRYVVFSSYASNLVSGTTGSTQHVYMHDMNTGTTTLVDASASGSIGSNAASYPQVSADGRFVVFHSAATNLVSGISLPGNYQVYVKDMHTGAIKILSVTSAGAAGNGDSLRPDISCDGNTVTFSSTASNLGVPTGQPSRLDAIVVSLGWSGDELTDITSGLESTVGGGPVQISCDGNAVLFVTSSTNVISPSTPSGYVNAYEYNKTTGVYTQVSLGNSGTQSNASSTNRTISASMSGDGRYVAFVSGATNVDTTHANGSDSGFNSNVYIRDVKKSTTEMVTVLPSGNSSRWVNPGDPVSISADGSAVVFPYNVPNIGNSARSLISGYNSGSTGSSYTNIFSAEMDY